MANTVYPGSNSRTLDQKFGEFPSLKDFGAKGDLQVILAATSSASTSLTSVFTSGAGTISSSGTQVTGASTAFLSQIQVGQYIFAAGQYARVLAIVDDTHLTTGGDATYAEFTTSLSGAAYTVGTGFNTATDIGKRVVVYGAGPNTGRETYLDGIATAGNSTNAYTVLTTVDTQAASKIGFAGNCIANGVTWQIFGSTSSSFSGEVSVYGPVALTPLANSASHIETPPTYRYYRVKIISTVSSEPGTLYCTISVWGYVLGTSIASITSPGFATMSTTAGSTVTSAYAYFGTDDTSAIQLAFDSLFVLSVRPGTADGGITLWAPRGNYLISSPIYHRRCIVLEGQSGGGTIFYADGASFPINSNVWNMTGTFQSDQTIAFFTRLEDVRIDCGHVPGSVGVFCDSLQENSGLNRVTVIQWTKTGIQSGTLTDQFGCNDWTLADLWVYPSTTAFLDDTVMALLLIYAVDTHLIGSTLIGQGGYICGYGRGLDISFGTITIDRLHVESANIGVHFNSSSGGYLQTLTTQTFVSTGVKIEGGLPVTLRRIQAPGANAIIDNGPPFTSGPVAWVQLYESAPFTKPLLIAAPLQMTGDTANPNVITLNPINFSGDNQGGFLSVNSASNPGFPTWIKTSTAASNNAMFLVLSATGIDVRIGPANQPAFVATGTVNVSGTAVSWVSGAVFNTSWPAGSQILLSGGIVGILASSPSSTTSLTLVTGAGTLTGVTYGVSTDPTAFGGTSPGASVFSAFNGVGAKTPRLYFDNTSASGAMEFGNNIGANRTRWQHGATSQAVLVLQKSNDSGATWQDVFSVNLTTGNIFFSNNTAPFPSGSGSGIYSGNGTPNGVVAAATGSVYLDFAGNFWFKTGGGSGNTGWVSASSSSGITQLTGDVTAGPGSGSQAATIASGAVTLAKMAALAGTSIIGNSAGGSATPVALTPAQVTAMLNLFSSSFQGLVPASGGGTTAFLRADGSWAVPAGGGSPGSWSGYGVSVSNLSSLTTNAAQGQQVGKTGYLRIQVQGTSNGINPTFSLPFTPADNFQTFAVTVFNGTSAQWIPAVCHMVSSAITVFIANGVGWGSGTSYSIWIQGVYETT